MRKVWLRAGLAVIVIGAIGVGWSYHQQHTGDQLLSLVSSSGVGKTDSHQNGQRTGTSQSENSTTRYENSTPISNALTGSNSQGTDATGNVLGSSSNRTGTATAAKTTASANSTNTNSTNTNSSSVNSTGSNTKTTSGTSTNATKSGEVGGSVSAGSFTVILSLHHGKTVLKKKTLVIHQGENLMQYMQANFNIQTAYGGGFVLAIDGIHSQWTGVPVSQRQPVDWFLYVNQKQAPVGAGSIVPRAGDVDDWDYHRWNPSTGQG